MATIRQVQTNFSSGEIDPLLRMRTDAGAYANAAARLRNVAMLNAGGVMRRPGTLHRANLFARCRLLPFEFSATERYVLAFSAGRLDVYDTEGVILQTLTTRVGGGALHWQADDLFVMTYTQVADVMIVAHQDWPPQVVRRTDATTFTVSDFAFDVSSDGNKVYQPYYKFADDTVTLTSGNSGTVTVTLSQPLFTAAYVGTRLRSNGTEILITSYVNATTVQGQVKGYIKTELDVDPFRIAVGSSVVEITHVGHGFANGTVISITGANSVGTFTAAQLNTSFVIQVLDDNRYAINVALPTTVSGWSPYEPDPISATSGLPTTSEDGGGSNVSITTNLTPTRQWDEQVFSPTNGYPGAVAFHEGRLWFGGTPAQPDGLWSSKINQYFNFDVGEGLDNDSIQITIGSEHISNIRHMVSNRDLQVFTATGEFYVPRSANAAITPSNIRVQRQTPYGCSTVTPCPFDGATLFVQSAGKAVREFIYNDGQASYASTDVTLLASHLINAPRDMAVLYGTPERGEQYALVVNGDGTLAVFHSARAENLAGWTGWNMSGAAIDAICTLGNAIYVSVLRHGIYRLEQFAPKDDVTLDGATVVTSLNPQTFFSVGTIYAGRTLPVVGDGQYLGDLTIGASGLLTLEVEVSRIEVGYDYPVEIKTLPANVALPTGALTGMPKRINRVILGLDSTAAVTLAGNRLILRGVTDDMSQTPEAFTGVKEFFLLGYAREAQITITQAEPLPLRLLGMAMEVSF